MSEWQIPQYLISMTTSCSPGSRPSNENGASGALAVGAAYPLVLLMRSRFREGMEPLRIADTLASSASATTPTHESRRRRADKCAPVSNNSPERNAQNTRLTEIA